MKAEREQGRHASIVILVYLIAFGLMFGAVAARVISACLEISPDLFSAFAIVTISGPESIIDSILENPFSIDFDKNDVKVAFACAFGIPFVFGAISLGKGWNKGKMATGAEHGDDRLAKESEMPALLDAKHPYNNIMHTQHSGMVLDEYDAKTKKKRNARNQNVIVFGISGLGKTFNLVKVTLMQSVGVAVPYIYHGWLNAIEHVHERLKHTPLIAITAPLLKWKQALDALRMKKMLIEAKRRGIGEGFDVVNTDPKGDNLRDMGHLLEAAGVKVKQFNTIDFDQSDKLNPLGYIDEYVIDCMPVNQIEYDASFLIEPIVDETAPKSFDADEWTYTLEMEKTKLPNPDDGTMQCWGKSLEGKASAHVQVEAKIESLTKKNPNVKDDDVYEEVFGEYAEGLNDDVLAEIVKAPGGFSRTAVTFALEVTNELYLKQSCEVRFPLPQGLVILPLKDKNGDTVKDENGEEYLSVNSYYSPGPVSYEAETNTIVWKPVLQPRDTQSKRSPKATLIIECAVTPITLPDGVMLTKVVNCLAENLQGEGNDNQDPFWPAMLRLALMSFVSFTFERFDPQYRTLPTVVTLLDQVLPDDGNAANQSVMDKMIDEWEYGEGSNKAPTGEVLGRNRMATTEKATAGSPSAPHPRDISLAVHCYRAFRQSAPETVQSVVATCQTAFVKLLAPDVQRVLSEDTLALDTLGDPNQKQAIFIVASDTDDTYDFLTALVIQLAIDLNMDKAFKKYGGKLPRHVRFELDEVRNLGKIPILVRAVAVVRSRNASIAMYVQSKAQLEEVYGEKASDTILDNCTTWEFLGAQVDTTLEMISKRIGEETVYSRTFQRQFGSFGVSGSSENIQGTARRVRTAAQLGQMESTKMLTFVYSQHPILDDKYHTREHPLYCYIDPGKRSLKEPLARYDKRFDFREYAKRRDKKKVKERREVK